MALLGNYSVSLKSPARLMSGQAGSDVRSNYNTPGGSRNAFGDGNFSNKNSTPNGYRPPYSWIIAQKTGGLATYTSIVGTESFSVNLAGGVNGFTNSPKTIIGTGSISSANMALIMAAIATLSGNGSFYTNPIIKGVLYALATLTSSGSVKTTSEITALAHAAITMISQGEITSASDLHAHGDMSTLITPLTALSPESLAIAVMKSIVETGMDVTQALRLLTAVAAGKSTIIDLGGGAATVTFRDIDDVENRVVADITGSERTTVTLNLGPQ